MRSNAPVNLGTTLFVLAVPFVGFGFSSRVRAQNQELQQRVAEIKEAAAKNKQSLTQYTWNELVIISSRDEEKKQQHFQVRLGRNGKQEKTSLDPPEDTPESGERLKRHIVEKKKEEYKECAGQMKAPAQQYVSPGRDLVQNAYQQGNIAIIPGGGVPNQIKLVIKNYLKSGNSLTLVF
jgi:hypothetical protein